LKEPQRHGRQVRFDRRFSQDVCYGGPAYRAPSRALWCLHTQAGSPTRKLTMGELGQVLCVLSIVLLAVMVIGHGLWVVAAWLLRAIGGVQPIEMGKPCASCGAGYGVKNGRCVVCGAVPHVPPGRQPLPNELQTTIEHIQRVARRGVASKQCEELISIFQAEIAELSPPSASPETATPPLGGRKLLPVHRYERPPHETPGPGLAPANFSSEVVDAILVEPPVATAPPPSQPAAVHPLDRPYVPPPPTPPAGRAARWPTCCRASWKSGTFAGAKSSRRC
jgi:hypothetical protein